MRNELTVATFEIRSLLSKPSFWLLTVLFPLFILVLTLGGQLMAGNAGDAAQEGLEALSAEGTEHAVAYVDLSGLIESLPPRMSADMVQAYPSESAAMSALEAGQVSEYYVVAADYVETGDITLVQREYAPLSRTNEGLLQTILNYNIVGAEAARWDRIDNPIGQIQVEQLAPPSAEAVQETATNPAVASIVPIAAVMLLFFVLVMSSGYMLRSVSHEKENRTVEVLLLSLRPRVDVGQNSGAECRGPDPDGRVVNVGAALYGSGSSPVADGDLVATAAELCGLGHRLRPARLLALCFVDGRAGRSSPQCARSESIFVCGAAALDHSGVAQQLPGHRTG